VISGSSRYCFTIIFWPCSGCAVSISYMVEDDPLHIEKLLDIDMFIITLKLSYLETLCHNCITRTSLTLDSMSLSCWSTTSPRSDPPLVDILSGVWDVHPGILNLSLFWIITPGIFSGTSPRTFAFGVLYVLAYLFSSPRCPFNQITKGCVSHGMATRTLKID
jgi:hypothetical protein